VITATNAILMSELSYSLFTKRRKAWGGFFQAHHLYCARLFSCVKSLLWLCTIASYKAVTLL